MFITTADFRTQLRDVNLNRIIDGDESILVEACQAAQDTLSNYLSTRFDVNVIFTQSPRNAYILQLGVTIAKYLLYERLPGATTPTKLDEKYKLAIQELRDLRDGKGGAGLPIRIIEGEPAYTMKMGGEPKRRLY